MTSGRKLVLEPDSAVFDIGSIVPTNTATIGVCASGGLDSTALLCALTSANVPFLVFNQKSSVTPHLLEITKRLGIRDVRVIDTPRVADATFQRMEYFLLWASCQDVQVDALMLGMLRTDKNIGRVGNYDVIAPLRDLSKANIINMIVQLGYEELLPLCFSCMRQSKAHCGECRHCMERLAAFEQLGIRDPATYA